jgi:protein-disulfide isomerase-like protein with CxxC motif
VKTGQEFIKHELDEAIAIQQAIVDAEQRLASEHPLKEAQQLIERAHKQDTKQLQTLQKIGQRFGASGKQEEVSSAMTQLMEETASSASQAESEAYEAHAVLVTLKRKQADAGDAMVKIAREMKDDEMKSAANELHDSSKRSAQELADALSKMAVQIATA